MSNELDPRNHRTTRRLGVRVNDVVIDVLVLIRIFLHRLIKLHTRVTVDRTVLGR